MAGNRDVRVRLAEFSLDSGDWYHFPCSDGSWKILQGQGKIGQTGQWLKNLVQQPWSGLPFHFHSGDLSITIPT